MPALHVGKFRPLIGGIGVYNPKSGAGMGTIGVVLSTAAGESFLLSCYHVFRRKDRQLQPPAEAIFQPLDPDRVAITVPALSDAQLDFALARVDNGITVELRSILGIGLLQDPSPPIVGMAVLKSGYETGVTEGVITEVNADFVKVGVPSGFPNSYVLDAAGDSGAIWVSKDGNSPIAMHIGGDGTASQMSKATRLDRIMTDTQTIL